MSPVTSRSSQPAREPSRGALAALVVVGLGCLLGVDRALVGGTGSSIASQAAHPSLALACAVARLLAIVALALVAHRRPRLPWRGIALGAGALLAVAGAVCSLASGGDAVGPGALVTGALAGAAEGALMLGWAVLLTRLPAQQVVICALGATAVAGVAICGLGVTAGAARAAVVAAGALAGAGCLAAAAPTRAEEADAGQAAPSPLPGFSAAMFVTCGFIAMVLYGLASALLGMTAGGLSFGAFGAAVGAGLLATVAVVLLSPAPRRLAWVPQFALLLVALVVALTTSWTSLPVALGLLSAVVFCQHCLRWIVLPVVCGPQARPATVGALLALTDSTVPYALGGAFGSLVAVSPQSLGSAAGVMALVLVVVLVCALLLERTAQLRAAQDEARVPAPAATAAPGAGDDDAERDAPAASGGPREEPEPPAAEPAPPTPEQRLERIAAERGFTARELEIAKLTAKGNSSLRIADILVISSSTVRFHQQNIYRKLDIHSRQEFIDLVNGVDEDRGA